jgi:hypothetical protein
MLTTVTPVGAIFLLGGVFWAWLFFPSTPGETLGLPIRPSSGSAAMSLSFLKALLWL